MERISRPGSGPRSRTVEVALAATTVAVSAAIAAAAFVSAPSPAFSPATPPPSLRISPEAFAAAESGLRGRPGDRQARLALARFYEAENRPEDALRHFQVLIRSDAKNVASRKGAARCLAALGRRREATAAWREALKLAPDDPEIYRDLGLALHRTGDSRRALRYLRKSLDLDPKQEKLADLVSRIASEQATADLDRTDSRHPSPSGGDARAGASIPARPPGPTLGGVPLPIDQSGYLRRDFDPSNRSRPVSGGPSTNMPRPGF